MSYLVVAAHLNTVLSTDSSALRLMLSAGVSLYVPDLLRVLYTWYLDEIQYSSVIYS